jgi:hypothetical protein
MKTRNFTGANRGNREGRGAKDTWSKIAKNFAVSLPSFTLGIRKKVLESEIK